MVEGTHFREHSEIAAVLKHRKNPDETAKTALHTHPKTDEMAKTILYFLGYKMEIFFLSEQSQTSSVFL